VSSRSGEGVDGLLDAIAERLPESPPLYPEDDVSDRPLRFLAAELVREAATDALDQELPYALAVEIEEFDESRADLVRIRANLIVERASQKKIVIGEGGRRIKQIGIRARARDREARRSAGAPRAVGEGRAALDQAASAHQGARVRLSARGRLHLRSRSARRAPERARDRADRREARAGAPARGGGPAPDRGHLVRITEVDPAARGRRGARVCAAELPGVRFSALVPNEQGYARFRSAGGIDMAAVFISASETHNRKNVNCSVAEQLERFRPVAERARADRVPLRAYVSTVCGCPYEGAVAIGAVTALVEKLRALGVDEISLGDTIGVGVPREVRALVAAVADVAPLASIALHLHDTYGRALANVARATRPVCARSTARSAGSAAARTRRARRATSRPRTW
jgi:hypothetical protein